MVLHNDRKSSWASIFMLKCEKLLFELENITFVVYLFVLSFDKHMKHHIDNDSMNTMVVVINDYS